MPSALAARHVIAASWPECKIAHRKQARIDNYFTKNTTLPIPNHINNPLAQIAKQCTAPQMPTMAPHSTRSARRVVDVKSDPDATVSRDDSINNTTIKADANKRKRSRAPSILADEEKTPVKKVKVVVPPRTRNAAAPRSTSKKPDVGESNQKADVDSRQRGVSATPRPAATSTPHSQRPAVSAREVDAISHSHLKVDKTSPSTKSDKRALRSKEGVKFKSELSQYFPEYDEIIGNEPKATHLLTVETPILISDSKTTKPAGARANGKAKKHPIKQFPDSLFTNIYQAQRIDFSFLEKHYNDNPQPDPIPESHFAAAHKRAERLERSIRNQDKGRAQHERDQIIRLRDALEGHDWLKVMGVSGITDTKKKEYEPARDYFIKGCEGIIERFRLWREEERRRKLEKELAQQEAEEDEEDEDEEEDDDIDDGVSDGDPPDYSDVDASAARQLHDEAVARSTPLTPSNKDKRKHIDPIPFVIPEESMKEFKSFYAKPHLRQAAIGQHRRSGRNISAFGQPLPDVPDMDFELPEEFLDENVLKDHARKKRREQRSREEKDGKAD